jgi:hypothetical protein
MSVLNPHYGRNPWGWESKFGVMGEEKGGEEKRRWDGMGCDEIR